MVQLRKVLADRLFNPEVHVVEGERQGLLHPRLASSCVAKDNLEFLILLPPPPAGIIGMSL